MKVSVITTCFNAAGFIEKTIRSVLSQTYRDFEYIIMDGGSGDGTMVLAESFAPAFEERGIPYHIFSEPDRGIYDGMNHAVARATGEYLNFMNADDEFFDENVLSAIFEGRDWEGTGIIYGDAAETEYGQQYLFVKNIDTIRQRMPFSHQSAFVKRYLLENHPFDLRYRIAADYDFLITCLDEGVKFEDCGIMVCRVSKDGVSSVNIYDTFVETEEMLRAHGCPRYTPSQLRKKLFFLRIRQIGMDILPASIKKRIRETQRRNRGQDIKV